MKINNRNELIKRREEYLAHLETQKKKVYVCGGTGCVAGGSMEIYEELKRLIEEKGLRCDITLEADACGDSIGLKKKRMPRLLRNGSCTQNRTSKAVLSQGQA